MVNKRPYHFGVYMNNICVVHTLCRVNKSAPSLNHARVFV